MIKNKIDYKLINIAVIALIVFLVYQTGNLWTGVLGSIWKMILPFFLAFIIAYALYPFLKFLTDHKIPKAIAIILILGIIGAIIAIVVALVVPLLFDQISSLINSIIAFVKEVSSNGTIDFGGWEDTITKSLNEIVTNVGKYATNGVTKAINISLDYLATGLITISAAIYLLVDMEHIRRWVKESLLLKGERAFQYVRILDHEMKAYLIGLIEVMGITIIEYTLVYLIIGHPNAVLLGILAMLGNLIPYFGGLLTNIVACVTAFVISPALFVKTLITLFILSGVDGYVINPLVYGKTNNVHPLIVIMSVFIGGKLLGVFGIMISFPVAVLIISTIKFFRKDINRKITTMKKKEA